MIINNVNVAVLFELNKVTTIGNIILKCYYYYALLCAVIASIVIIVSLLGNDMSMTNFVAQF